MDGGWQIGGDDLQGHLWDSCPDQTWSATSYLGAVLHGVFGIQLQEEGIALRPSVPACLADSAIEELMIRGKRYALRISGHGSKIISLTVNGLPLEKAFLPYSNGTETTEILLTLE